MATALAAAPAEGGTVLSCRVTPSAKKDEITGLEGGAVKVKLHAPPVDGKANKALAVFLGKTLGVPKGRIAIVKGETSRLKKVFVKGLAAGEILQKIKEVL